MIKLTRASSKVNEGITIRTSQFSRDFDLDAIYVLSINDKKVQFNVSRNGDTLYATRSAIAGVLPRLPKVGKPVFANISSIRKVK